MCSKVKRGVLSRNPSVIVSEYQLYPSTLVNYGIPISCVKKGHLHWMSHKYSRGPIFLRQYSSSRVSVEGVLRGTTTFNQT